MGLERHAESGLDRSGDRLFELPSQERFVPRCRQRPAAGVYHTKQVLQIVGLATLVCVAPLLSEAADSSDILGLDPCLTLSGNFDAGYRKTQFFEKDHNVGVIQWDSRLEVWLPPFRTNFSYGPYIRFAGIAATKDPAWENGLLAGPGFGGQMYPFSLSVFHQEDQTPLLVQLLGPLRLFGEYNLLDYWGQENEWRPKHQVRAGADYWLALNPNNIHKSWWTEVWAGGWWQSANEFDPHYDAWIFAQSFRGGLRLKDKDILSWISPYAVVESSLTDNQAYYWENRLLAGGGVRIAPPLKFSMAKGVLTRLVFYVEYVRAAAYYRTAAPSSIPDYDWRAGVSFSIGEWYHDPFQH